MTITLWIAGFGLMTAGILVLIRGIKLIRKAVGGSILLKLPLTQPDGLFIVTQPGDYAIWQSGKTLQRVPVKMAVPTIVARQTGEKILVQPTFSGMRVNNGGEGRIQLFTFRAEAGHYELEQTANAASLESSYFLEVRERRPGYLLVGGILLLLFAAGCLIAGLILPAIAPMIGGGAA